MPSCQKTAQCFPCWPPAPPPGRGERIVSRLAFLAHVLSGLCRHQKFLMMREKVPHIERDQRRYEPTNGEHRLSRKTSGYC
jgi:hypothetical protein